MTAYTLYYWPLPFRGEFIRAVLRVAGQTYQEPGVDTLIALKDQGAHAQPLPFMAPPVLVDHGAGVTLAQMPAILRYLGGKHRLMRDDPVHAALTDKIIGDANDVLDELTLFGGRSMWTLGEWETFTETRLPRWMAIFEHMLRGQGVDADAGFFGADLAPGLADVTVAVLWGVMTAKLSDLRPLLERRAPTVSGLCDRVWAWPELATLRTETDQRFGDVYCGGQIEASIRDMLARHGV